MSTLPRPLAVIAAAVAAGLVIGGCGTTTPSRGTVRSSGRGTTALSRTVGGTSEHAPALARAPVGSRALCQEIPAVRAIAVQRVNEYPQHHIHFSFPARITITSRPGIDAIARALCALRPQTIVFCPNDFGIVYNLTFYPSKLELVPVRIDATGCGSVTGLGHPTRAITALRFWSILGSAMKLPGAPTTAVKLLQGGLPWIAGS